MMNLYIHNIKNANLAYSDTLLYPKFKEGEGLKQFDVVIANPPWNQDGYDEEGHNWVANGSFLERHGSYNSAIGISDYTAQVLDCKWVIIHRKERKALNQESLCPLCSLWLNAFSSIAHERAQPEPAVHLGSSRAGA